MPIYAVARYNFDAVEDTDLTIKEGERLEILQRNGEWWFGRNKKGDEGIFPFDRVELQRPEPLPSLSPADPDSHITSLTNSLKEKNPTFRGGSVFSLAIDLKSKNRVLTSRQAVDFRRLNYALTLLEPSFPLAPNDPLPPHWADEMDQSPQEAKRKAKALQQYLIENWSDQTFQDQECHTKELFQLLVVKWARARKSALKNGKASAQVKLNKRDSRDEIIRKIDMALAHVYQKKLPDEPKVGTPASDVVLAEALYPWRAQDETELELSVGEKIRIVGRKTIHEGWWSGENKRGEIGLFPSNYVKETTDPSRYLPPNTALPSNRNDTFHPTATQDPGRSRNQRGTNNNRARRRRSSNKGSSSKSMANVNSSSNGQMSNDSSDASKRERIIERDFCVKNVDAYDELGKYGVAIFQSKDTRKHIRFQRRGDAGAAAQNGDKVTIKFSAYVWDPQTQILREFASSDKLKAPPKGIQRGDAGASGEMMSFVIGKKQVIDGLEAAVKHLRSNTLQRVVIAPSKGYGEAGSPPEIPGNTFLVYDLTVTNVQKDGSFQEGGQFDRSQIFSVGISRPNVGGKAVSRQKKRRRGRNGA